MNIKIATWNMDWWKRKKDIREKAWKYLEQKIDPDIALIQEAVPPADKINSGNVLWREIRGTYRFGSGIITKNFPIQEVAAVEFGKSYHGAIVVGDIGLPSGPSLTVISLYGLQFNNNYVTSTLHHMLSDLTPLLTGKLGKRRLVIGGDFNADRLYDKYHRNKPSHSIFFDRLEDFGLANCLEILNKGHVRTISSKKAKTPYQDDYIYISKSLVDNILDCYVVDEQEIYELSDHSPVVAEIDIS